MSETIKNVNEKELFGHPTGLYILFFTELWERFSYYGMRAILTLYMLAKVSSDNPGLGWEEGKALAIYGWYTMLVYVVSIPGGIIADKILGQKKSVMIGGWLLVAGHGVLSIEQDWAFFTGLGLIVLGVGMLKPNISTMVGGLYKEGDPRRDKGFSIFYIGINVGAAVAAILVGVIAKEYGWHYGFGLAAIGMVIGQLVYVFGQKYLSHVGNAPDKSSNNEYSVSIAEIFKQMLTTTKILIVLLLLIAISVAIPLQLMETEIIAYMVFFIFLSIVVGFMMTVYQDLTGKVEKDRFIVLLLSFLIVIVFWGAFEQAGGLLNIYAEQKTNRFLPAFDYTVPAAFFQSLNPSYIIIFGIPVALFWSWMKNKGKEASSIFKMAIGVIIMGLGFVFMVFATIEYENNGEAALYWLVFAYLLHTIGELSASPVALSFITKLAPLRYGALMMGLYFAATGLGNKVAGVIGESSQAEPIKIELTANESQIKPFVKNAEKDSIFIQNKGFRIESDAYLNQNEVILKKSEILSLFKFQSDDYENELKSRLSEYNATINEPLKVFLSFDYKEGKYIGQIIVDQFQTDLEFKTFAGIVIFTVAFGILVILLLKPLKRLTHGAEEKEVEGLEQEGFELADDEVK
ncbi:proton-dependent oligopeptide transporter, POT family [Psychroflexus salarius]|uniref:Proton-dependent oligopeptide transporter, POT family n=1 Tax=Psychroflexus salarius TaxID=1155689 RepID=A0A1M4VST8_9FLAO|nr:peptide MFS transporter [Psychroflexus salarius]SHE72191.1 proton-dependent oligopeptide transporter, POT family [Psychroflexus salarius]